MSHTSNPASDIARDPSDCLILITKFVFLRLFPEMGYLDFFFFFNCCFDSSILAYEFLASGINVC